ncbi:MAG: ATP-binding protein, partial [Hyphomicrobiaceae bacterium]
DRLAQSDPSNAGWQRDLSESLDNIGDVLRAQGNLGEALASYRAGNAIFDRLAQSDPSNTDWQVDLAVSHAMLAQVHEAGGEIDDALAAFTCGRDILASIPDGSGNQHWTDMLAEFNEEIARLAGGGFSSSE